MTRFQELADRIRHGDAISPALAALLAACTPVTRAGMWLRRRAPRVRVNARVISVGNLTVGGTGKTPVVIERACAELRSGRNVAVLTRGYGSERKGVTQIVAASSEAGHGREWLGDEPELMRRRVPGVVIGKGADRVYMAHRVISEFGCDTIILDDGFQYVRLERDENVLVVDATNPFGNRRLIPRGILREPVKAAARATRIILTRCDQAGDITALAGELRALCPDVPMRFTRHAPVGLWRVADGAPVDLGMLRGAEVAALCAIGNPDAFVKTLEGLRAVVVRRVAFPDHSTIPAEAIPDKRFVVVTTEKDAMRLRHVHENVFALAVDVEDVRPESLIGRG